MTEETAEASLRRLELAVGNHERLPGTNEEATKVEELLEDEMSKLSMSEQDVVSFEVHGIAAEVEESPELVAKSLAQMEIELQKIKKKASYEKALKIDPNYVTDQSFRKLCLRSEGFDCKHAAQRLVLHFRQKEELFGSGEILARDVRLSDMDPSDLEDMKTGAVQVLPSCDISGRAVVCMFLRKWTEKARVRGVQRAFYYAMQSVMMQDKNMAKKGVVVLLNLVGDKRKNSVGLNVLKSMYQIRLSVPHRLDALHICYDNKSLRPFISGLRFFMDKRGRTRCRIHYGAEDRVLFQLQTFGIPIQDDSPLRQINGVFPMTWHEEWLQNRQAQEMEAVGEDEAQRILIPRRFDVLLGRSVKIRTYTGNLRAVHLVNMWQDRYDGAPNRSGKTDISNRIVSIIHESNGRFLRWEGNGWVEVSDSEAREKVAHWFRNQRKVSNEEDKQQTAAQKRNRSTDEVTE